MVSILNSAKNIIKKYSRIYLHFLKTSIAEVTSYRLHFVLLITMDILFFVTTLFTVDFLFSYLSNIGPWNREQFLFFTSVVLLIDSIHMTFISENFWQLSHYIRLGQLDYILLRPVNFLFSIFFRYIRPASIISIFIGIFLVIYFARPLNLTIVDLTMLSLYIILGLGLLIFLEISLSMLMFFTKETKGINFLRLQFQQVSRWPDFIYHSLFKRFFTIFFPILLVTNSPVNLILYKNYSVLLFFIIALLISIIVAWKLFLFSVKYYESASLGSKLGSKSLCLSTMK